MYTIDGEEVELFKEIEDGFLAKPIFSEYNWEDEDDGEEVKSVSDKINFYPILFKNPPIERFADDIVKLKKEANKISEEIGELERTRESEKSLLHKISKYPFVQTMVDYLTGDFSFILDMQDYEVRKKEQSYNTNFIKVTNTKSYGWALYKMRNDSYDSSDDRKFRIFKTMEELLSFCKGHLTSELNRWSSNWSRADGFKKWFGSIHHSNPCKDDPDFKAMYEAKYKRLVDEDKEAAAAQIKKEMDALEEKRNKLQIN